MDYSNPNLDNRFLFSACDFSLLLRVSIVFLIFIFFLLPITFFLLTLELLLPWDFLKLSKFLLHGGNESDLLKFNPFSTTICRLVKDIKVLPN